MMPLLDLPDGLADDLTGHLTGAGELVELKRAGPGSCSRAIRLDTCAWEQPVSAAIRR